MSDNDSLNAASEQDPTAAPANDAPPIDFLQPAEAGDPMAAEPDSSALSDFAEAEQALARRITRPSPWDPSLDDETAYSL